MTCNSAMSAFGGKADIGLTPRNVRYWHKADITAVLIHVRFLGVKRTLRSQLLNKGRGAADRGEYRQSVSPIPPHKKRPRRMPGPRSEAVNGRA